MNAFKNKWQLVKMSFTFWLSPVEGLTDHTVMSFIRSPQDKPTETVIDHAERLSTCH